MSEILTETPQAQPKVETQSGLDRLSMDEIYGNPSKEPVKSETSATQETEKLESTETQIPEEKSNESSFTETEKKPEIPESGTDTSATSSTPSEEVGFEDKGIVSDTDEGSWKAIIQASGYEVPNDYSEEKGFEIFNQLKENEINQKIEIVKNYRESDLFSELPQPVQGEAKLIFDLMKTGQTLSDIVAPLQQIKEWKGMSKEELIRKNLEGLEGYTSEMVDHKMEQIVAANHVDIEYQILMNAVNTMEKNLYTQQQQQIQAWNAKQAHVTEQRLQQEFNSFKAAMDKVPSFMDKKLSEENKASILNDYTNGYADTLLKNPEKLAKFMLYDKYGEQGIKYLQSRAIEKANLEQKKNQLNIPPTIQGNANRIETTTQIKNGIDRLANDPRYAL